MRKTAFGHVDRHTRIVKKLASLTGNDPSNPVHRQSRFFLESQNVPGTR